MWISRVCQGVAVAGLEAAAEAVEVWTLLRLTQRGGFFAYLQNIRQQQRPLQPDGFLWWFSGWAGRGWGSTAAANIIAAAKTRYLEM